MSKQTAEQLDQVEATEEAQVVEPEVVERGIKTTSDSETLPAQVALTPLDLLSQAIDKNLDLDKLEKLMVMQERHERREAEKAFAVAMSAFRAEGVKIIKRANVDFTSSKGRTNYNHATLGDAVEQITEAMSKHGLSHRWNTEQEGNRVKVTCIIMHLLGHRETNCLSAPEDHSGNKNVIQAIGSTVTYLERYTLLSALGLATHDQDDDGRLGAEQGEPPRQVEQRQTAQTGGKPHVSQPKPKGTGDGGKVITSAQLEILQSTLDRSGKSAADLCKEFKVNSLKEMPVGKINDALKWAKG